jgi:hypothetical protein
MSLFLERRPKLASAAVTPYCKVDMPFVLSDVTHLLLISHEVYCTSRHTVAGYKIIDPSPRDYLAVNVSKEVHKLKATRV